MKPMRYLLPVFCFCFGIPLGKTQDHAWARCFWGDSVLVSGIAVSTTGSVFMGGTSVGKIGCDLQPAQNCILYDLGAGVQAGYVVRMSTNGDVEHSYVFTPPPGMRTEVLGVAKNVDDGVWVVHREQASGSSPSLILTRFTAALAVAAQVQIPMDTALYVCKMAVDPEGNAYVAYITVEADDLIIRKVDPTGVLVWSKTGSGSLSNLYNLQVTPAGQLMVHARSLSFAFQFDGATIGTSYSSFALLLNPSDGSLVQGVELHRIPTYGDVGLGANLIATEDGRYLLSFIYSAYPFELRGHTIPTPPGMPLRLNTILAELNPDFSLSKFTLFHSLYDGVHVIVTDVIKDAGGGYYLGGNWTLGYDLLQDGDVVIPFDWQISGRPFIIRLDSDMDFVWFRWFKSRGTNPMFSPEYIRDLDLLPDNSLLVHGSMEYGTVISPPDTMEAYQSNAFVMRFTDANRAIGRIWVDADNNGNFDATEVAAPFRAVTDDNGQVLSFTDLQGKYHAVFPGNAQGTLRVEHPAGMLSVDPPQYDLDFNDSPGGLMDSLDFRLVANASFTDMAVYATEKTRPRPGFAAQWRCVVSNQGTTGENVSLKVVLPDSVEYISSDPPATLAGDTLVWSVSNLPGFHTSVFTIAGRVSEHATLGSTVITNGFITVPTGDVDSGNNQFVLEQLVSGAFDPNDKQSVPTGQIAADLTPELLDGPIDYLIRFQNTGTDTAFRVVVLDALSALLDPATLRVIDHSHPMRIDLRGPNTVAFEFDKILLPDSTTNEEESHGFVRFSIRPKQTLAPDDKVKNRAAIYFDYNAPIITNETVLHIVLSVGTYTPPDGLSFTVSPNPAIDRLLLSAPGGLPSGGRAVLYDALQRPALHQTLPGGETLEMNLSTLPAGVFVLVLYDASGRVLGAKKVEKM